MGIGYNPKIVTDGLVFSIDAANKKSYPGTGTSVIDTINRLTGTLNGAVYTNGYFSFDGVDDFLSFSDDNVLDATSPFCLEIWLYPISVNTIYAKGQYGVHWNYGLRSNAVRHNNGDYTAAGYSLTLNAWQNIILRYDGSKNQIYKNGFLVSDFTPGSWTPATGTGMFAIGRAGGSASEYSQMYVSKFSLYKKLLSDTEIQQNFNTMRGRFGV